MTDGTTETEETRVTDGTDETVVASSDPISIFVWRTTDFHAILFQITEIIFVPFEIAIANMLC